MEYRAGGGVIAARLDIGDEIVGCVARIAEETGTEFATVSGIGALSLLAVSVYDVGKKVYFDNVFEEPTEIVSLSGTVTRMNGKPYVHLHASAGRADGSVCGGHLKRAVIGATGEIVLRPADIAGGSVRDERTGLNVVSVVGAD